MADQVDTLTLSYSLRLLTVPQLRAFASEAS
jgi:hypothetical protein